MNFYKDEYTIERTLNFKPNLEQKFLLEYTGREFPAAEAKKVWPRVIDHKWYLGEHLGRDIGLRVAAADYVQNFYRPPADDRNLSGTDGPLKRIFRTLFYTVGPPPVSKKYTY